MLSHRELIRECENFCKLAVQRRPIMQFAQERETQRGRSEFSTLRKLSPRIA